MSERQLLPAVAVLVLLFLLGGQAASAVAGLRGFLGYVAGCLLLLVILGTAALALEE